MNPYSLLYCYAGKIASGNPFNISGFGLNPNDLGLSWFFHGFLRVFLIFNKIGCGSVIKISKLLFVFLSPFTIFADDY